MFPILYVPGLVMGPSVKINNLDLDYTAFYRYFPPYFVFVGLVQYFFVFIRQPGALTILGPFRFNSFRVGAGGKLSDAGGLGMYNTFLFHQN